MAVMIIDDDHHTDDEEGEINDTYHLQKQSSGPILFKYSLDPQQISLRVISTLSIDVAYATADILMLMMLLMMLMLMVLMKPFKGP